MKKYLCIIFLFFLSVPCFGASKTVPVWFLLNGVRDTTGALLTSGKVYTYIAGTTTNKTTWTAADKSVAAANPVILDSYGAATIYADGLYKFVIKDSGDNTIYTWDNIQLLVYGDNLRINESAAPDKYISDLVDGGKDVILKPARIESAKGADVASATTLVLGTDGGYFDITGTTTIAGIQTISTGTVARLHFDGALTLTHNATSFVLPNSADIVTTAGDEYTFIEYSTGNWRLIAGTNYISSIRGYYTGLHMEDTSSGNAVTISAGLQIDLNGFFYNTSANQEISLDTAGHREDGSRSDNTIYYVYVIPGTSPLVAGTNFKFSSTAPSWDSTKSGWYHPTSTTWRAIGSLWNDIGVIRAFNQDGNYAIYDSDGTELLQNNGTSISKVNVTTDPDSLVGVMATHYELYLEIQGTGTLTTADAAYAGYIGTSTTASSYQLRTWWYSEAAVTPGASGPLADIRGFVVNDGTIQYRVNSATVQADIYLLGWRLKI